MVLNDKNQPIQILNTKSLGRVYWSIGVIQQSLNRTNPNSDGNRYARCETLCEAGVPERSEMSRSAGDKLRLALCAELDYGELGFYMAIFLVLFTMGRAGMYSYII